MNVHIYIYIYMYIHVCGACGPGARRLRGRPAGGQVPRGFEGCREVLRLRGPRRGLGPAGPGGPRLGQKEAEPRNPGVCGKLESLRSRSLGTQEPRNVEALEPRTLEAQGPASLEPKSSGAPGLQVCRLLLAGENYRWARVRVKAGPPASDPPLVSELEADLLSDALEH